MSNASDFEIKSGVLKKYSGPAGDVDIPEGVREIGDRVFCYQKITGVRFPASLRVIGTDAFQSCSQLRCVDIPADVTEIGCGAFTWCKRLETVTLPEGVLSIGGRAFYGCDALEEIVIPKSVTVVGSTAFAGCQNLRSVQILNPSIVIEEGAFFGCPNLVDPEGFVVVSGRLVGYDGSAEKVVIPDGVVSIGECVLQYQENLEEVVLPEGLVSIGKAAFRSNEKLRRITIPESVKEIGEEAFYFCKNLSEVELRCKEAKIGQKAFTYCALPRDKEGFVRAGWLLLEYQGTGKTAVVPEGITEIGERAFAEKRKLTSVVIPEGVKKIGADAFGWSSNLERIELPASLVTVSRDTFTGCDSVKEIVLAEGNPALFFDDGVLYAKQNGQKWLLWCPAAKTGRITVAPDTNRLQRYAFSAVKQAEIVLPDGLPLELEALGFFWDWKADNWCREGGTTYSGSYLQVADKLPAEYASIFLHTNLTPRDLAYVVLYQQQKAWQKALETVVKERPALIPEAVKEMAVLLEQGKRAGKPDRAAAEFAMTYLDQLDAESLNALCAVLEKKKAPQYQQLKAEPGVKRLLGGEKKKTAAASETNSIEDLVDENWVSTPKIRDLEKLIKKGIPYADQSKLCSARALIYVIHAYEGQMQEKPRQIGGYRTDYVPVQLCPLADQVAAGLDQTALRERLQKLADKGECLLAFGRYADGGQITGLLDQMKKWENWGRYAGPGRKNIIIARGGLMLSDTKEAMLALDKAGVLDGYAAMRGTSAEMIRNTVLYDLGLGETGVKVYDLGGTSATICLQPDLTFRIDVPGGKTAKSLPKKGADPELHAAATADFTAAKKMVKEMLRERKAHFLKTFLSGEMQTAESWQDTYLHNPVLRQIASLMVWQQGQETFRPDGMNLVRSDGSGYAIGTEPICLAHPMEMGPEAVSAWQRHFTVAGLKQPFAQIWEPAIDPKTIQADRYQADMIPLYRFLKMESHGIEVTDEDYYSAFYVSMAGCRADVEQIDYSRHELDPELRFRINSFTFQNYNRQVNHIVAYLDKVTVFSRVRRDDESIASSLSQFTLAQITEFIQVAAENDCAKVMAILLDYKQKTFPDFDPMDEFTLE